MVYVKMGNRLSVRSKYLLTLDVTLLLLLLLLLLIFFCFFVLIELLHTSNTD